MSAMRTRTSSKLLSLYVAFVFLLSVAGPGLAVYAGDETNAPLEQATEVAAPVEVAVPEQAEEPAAVTADAVPVAPVVQDAVSEEAIVSEEVAPVTAEAELPVAKTAPVAEVAPTAIGSTSIVTPILVPGNPALAPGGYRISPVSGTYTYGSIEITVTVYDTANGEVFDFISNTPLLKVVAKGGSGGANVYNYASPGVYSDTGLHAPLNPSGKWADLSHIDLYFGTTPVEPDRGRITVVKFNDLDGDGLMGDTEPTLDGWVFTLTPPTGGTTTGTSGDDGAGTVIFDDLLAGSYSVNETAKPGWHNTTVLPVVISLAEGEDETIYVGNAEDEPEEFTKTFALTFAQAPIGSAFSVSFTLNGEQQTLPLTGTGPVYSADVTVVEGDVIGSVQWWLTLADTEYLLGTSEGETIEGDVTNSLTYGPAIGGYKFNDLDANGIWGQGELGLAGWTINLYRVTYSDPIAFGAIAPQAVMVELYATTVTGAGGSYSFGQVLPGTYYVSEEMQSGWTQTLAPSGEFTVTHDTMLGDLNFGNNETEVPPDDVTKTFTLTYNGDVPADTTFRVRYILGTDLQDVGPTVVDGTWLDLTGSGPFSANVELPYGTTIVSVDWYAQHGLEQILLGTTVGETLTEDTNNQFTYNGDVSGFKFNDINGDGIWDEGEPGIEGWTIYLYRQAAPIVPSAAPVPAPGYVLYATTLTGTGGAYHFSGVLPGTYYVAEEDREGWEMTVGPEGTFVVVGEQPVTGLTFGNTEPFLPFTDIDLAITKVANVETAVPGATITYTLTYRNLGETEASDFTIVDDFDERYVTVTDAAGGVVSGGKITWSLAGPLAMADGPQIITYTVKVNSTMPTGTTNVDNVVVIDHPDDSNPTNDRDDERVIVEDPFLPFTDDPFLPFTGGEGLLLLTAALVSVGLGVMLRRKTA